jgi:hypothetical protein
MATRTHAWLAVYSGTAFGAPSPVIQKCRGEESEWPANEAQQSSCFFCLFCPSNGLTEECTHDPAHYQHNPIRHHSPFLTNNDFQPQILRQLVQRIERYPRPRHEPAQLRFIQPWWRTFDDVFSQCVAVSSGLSAAREGLSASTGAMKASASPTPPSKTTSEANVCSQDGI